MCDATRTQLFRPWIGAGDSRNRQSAASDNPIHIGISTKSSAVNGEVGNRLGDSRDKHIEDEDSASSSSSTSAATRTDRSYDRLAVPTSYQCQPVYVGRLHRTSRLFPTVGLVTPEDTVAAARAAFESSYARSNQQLVFGAYPCGVEEAVKLINQQDAAAKHMKKLRPKKFRCQYCDVAFSNNGQLKGHIRIHTGERPFNCDAEGCGKSFTRNEELTRHKRIHTGIRPHECVLCGKRFGRKDHLKKHMRTHEHRTAFHVTAPGMGPFGFSHGSCPQFHPMAPYMYPL